MGPGREDILALIAEEARIDRGRLTPDASLASLGIASLDVVSVLFAVEDRYGVEVAPETVASAATLDDFVDRIVERIAAG